MRTTNVDRESESPDVRFSIVGIENDKSKPELIAGAHAEKTPEFEELEGKKVFPTKVVKRDTDGIIVVMYKKGGEVQTLTLDEYTSKVVAKNRQIKGAKAVPAKKVTAKGSKETNSEENSKGR